MGFLRDIIRLMRGFSESTVHNMGIGMGVPMYIEVWTAKVAKKGHILLLKRASELFAPN